MPLPAAHHDSATCTCLTCATRRAILHDDANAPQTGEGAIIVLPTGTVRIA